ncbi:hypothetical protein GOP47_0029069 [Adiantum capillus-veneris]|nr:hypothetical protein GOP47_0029069 [Adiantum capillus-veneris]
MDSPRGDTLSRTPSLCCADDDGKRPLRLGGPWLIEFFARSTHREIAGMSKDADAEALAMDYSPRAFNRGADVHGSDAQPEALAMGIQRAPDSPSPNPSRARISATNDSSAFINASDESPLIQRPIRSEVRTSQPAGGISTISFGANLTLEESEQLQKRRPGYDSKRREMLGSRIFDQDVISEPAPTHVPNKTLPAGLVTPMQSGSRNNAIVEDDTLSPKRQASLAEMSKQRELTGTIFGAGRDTPTSRRPNSSAKSKELEGSNIFGRSSQGQLNNVTPKCLANDLYNCQEQNAPPRTSVKVSNPAGGRSQIIFGCDGGQQLGAQCKKQGHDQKAAELSGHNIFKDEASIAITNNSYNQNERIISAAKKREMLGNDIFSDSSPINEGHPRRVRQPPGGASNLKLY